MQADYARHLAFVEVATNGIANIGFERRHVVGFGKDRLAECARCVAAFGRFLNYEDDLRLGC